MKTTAANIVRDLPEERKEEEELTPQEEMKAFLFQSFHLLFKDQFKGIPATLYDIFRGEIGSDPDCSDFVESADSNVVQVKYLILQAARVAFHYCMDLFVMGEMELPEDPKEFINEVEQIEAQWFFGGEDYLWNLAIERGLPNLERIIAKKGQYFAHRLKYGQSEEQSF